MTDYNALILGLLGIGLIPVTAVVAWIMLRLLPKGGEK